MKGKTEQTFFSELDPSPSSLVNRCRKSSFLLGVLHEKMCFLLSSAHYWCWDSVITCRCQETFFVLIWHSIEVSEVIVERKLCYKWQLSSPIFSNLLPFSHPLFIPPLTGVNKNIYSCAHVYANYMCCCCSIQLPSCQLPPSFIHPSVHPWLQLTNSKMLKHWHDLLILLLHYLYQEQLQLYIPHSPVTSTQGHFLQTQENRLHSGVITQRIRKVFDLYFENFPENHSSGFVVQSW